MVSGDGLPQLPARWLAAWQSGDVAVLEALLGDGDGERDHIRSHSREIVRNFLEEPGFIGIVTGFQGGRGFTVTAWEDEAAMHRGLARQHRTAMRELRKTDLAPGVWTSVWQPLRINRIWTRCAACTSLAGCDRRSPYLWPVRRAPRGASPVLVRPS